MLVVRDQSQFSKLNIHFTQVAINVMTFLHLPSQASPAVKLLKFKC